MSLPPVVHSIAELVDFVRTRSTRGSNVIVGIEGASTAGKTTTANQVAQELGGTPIHTDQFYNKGVTGPRYQDGLRLEEMAETIARLANHTGPIVVEGICLRETLQSLGRIPSIMVYCKKISSAGVWHDDPELNGDHDPESGFVQERVDCWWFDYHKRAKPLELADVVFQWSETAL
jgi:hypothetical protein